MGKTILVVEDDDAIRSLLVELLTEAGHDVHEASGGSEGLDLVAVVRPDLIILDKLMAAGDGTMFARGYRAMPGPHSPIIGLTAARDAEGWGPDIGVKTLLTKPFDIDDLMKAVEEAAA
ncbi:MAG: response regulator transcription factor [Chloroflexi bacterium]|nr:response regulator transcription factor [Chloroflexota bacterium]